jgi:uncharacterized coiled-coil DUF342 family protein
LPQIDRPSKEKLDKVIEGHEHIIAGLENQRLAISAKIDAILNTSKDSALGAARAEFNKLRAQQQTIMKERSVIFDKRDAIKAATDSLINDASKAKGAVKFTSLEAIEKRIRELHVKQSTCSMSLAEEKKLVKEIEDLSASKKVVAQLAAKEDAISGSKLEAKDIKGAIAEKAKELAAINEKLDAAKKVLDEVSAKEQGTRGAIPDLYKERDAVRAKINAEYKGKKKAFEAFKRDNNLWYEYQKQQKKIKEIEAAAEKKRWEEEKAAWLKAKEEEELKKTPYEEEMALCEYLANYFTTTYLTKDVKKAEEKKEAAAPVSDDPFAAFAAVNKKSDDTFMQLGKGTRKEKLASSAPKAKKAAKEAPFSVALDTYDQFALLNLTPPTSLADVAGVVQELNDKKVWYTQQERGAVETAADIRKKQQAAAKKLEKKSDAVVEGVEAEAKKKEVKKTNGKTFSLNDDDFAPLGVGGGTVAEVSWGKKEVTAE